MASAARRAAVAERARFGGLWREPDFLKLWAALSVSLVGTQLTTLAWLLVPLAAGPTVAVVAVLATARAVDGGAGAVANIHQWSLRQAVTPDELEGRVNASHRFFVFGSGAIGALLGGVLGSAVGLRPALLVCAIGALLTAGWLIFSPVRRLREQPTRTDEPPAVG